jgi:hypothetical protein
MISENLDLKIIRDENTYRLFYMDNNQVAVLFGVSPKIINQVYKEIDRAINKKVTRPIEWEQAEELETYTCSIYPRYNKTTGTIMITINNDSYNGYHTTNKFIITLDKAKALNQNLFNEYQLLK